MPRLKWTSLLSTPVMVNINNEAERPVRRAAAEVIYLPCIHHEVDIENRISQAQKDFGALRVDVLRSDLLNLKLKGRVFNTIVLEKVQLFDVTIATI